MEIDRTPLHIAIEKGKSEIVKLLLTRKELDVNIKSISNFLNFFNAISNKIKI